MAQVFAFEGAAKSAAESAAVDARRSPQGPAPSKRHIYQKNKPQNDLRHPAA
jgi:hypothetical protein